MKKIVLSLLVFGSLVMANEVTMKIEGMTCGGCAVGINEGIPEDYPNYVVHADYKTALMSVSTKNGKQVNIKEVQTALDEMGFKGTLNH